jgi:stage V sporulation protein B
MLYGTPNAGASIAVLSLSIVFMGMHQVTTGVLQGLGHTAIPLVNMVLSAFCKIGLCWTLTALPAWGIEGAAWATNADFGIAALLNMYFVYRYVGFSLPIKDTLRAIAAAGVMGTVVLFLYHAMMARGIPNTPTTLAAIAVGAIAYGAFLLLIGGVQTRDVEKIPKVGAKAAGLLQRLGMLKK